MKKDKNPVSKQNRRDFIKNSGLTMAGIYIVPRSVLGGKGYTSPSDKLQIAVVGAGGRGNSHVRAAAEQYLVALCDVDDRQAARSYKENPDAKRYKDFRKMYDEMGSDIDAVMVATPDHTHAVVAIPAIRMGKHVYCEKPLTHNIYEARLMATEARKHKVVTQMGNQGASGEGVRQTMEWIQSGLIGEIHTIQSWTNRPVWPQGVKLPTEKEPIPAELDWDLWLGPAQHRPFHPTYLPFNWRGWWEFGTGALGDMGCHVLDPVFKSMNLGAPDRVEASLGTVYQGFFNQLELTESCPPASIIHFSFPKTKNHGPIQLSWYDGGILPKRPAELGSDEPFGAAGGGALFEGTHGKLLCDVYGENPRLLPTSLNQFIQVDKTLPRVENGSGGHMQDWFRACKEGGETSSGFDFAGPFTEAILLGNLALRGYYAKVEAGKDSRGRMRYQYPARTTLHWDAENMKITNVDIVNQFVKRAYRKGWELGM